MSLLSAVVACTSSNSGAPAIAVTPGSADVLTCSTAQFSAEVTGLDDVDVSWSATAGTIDANGLYASPTTVQAVSVTATSTADPTLAATAPVTLATAFPSTAAPIAGSVGTDGNGGAIGIYQHQIVASGKRAYAIWPVNPIGSSSVSAQVARSDDGGATWTPGVDAIGTTLANGQQTDQGWVECVALAIDAGDPDVVYATARVSGNGSTLSESVGVDESLLAFAVSTDGGATFAAPTVLRATTAVGYCADVISPAPDTVVVVDPTDDCD